MVQPYLDRKDAGRKLAQQLEKYRFSPDVLVLGLPKGGVVVAGEIASTLDTELDVFLVRKLGTPGQPELAMGAIAEGGVLLLNESVVQYLSISRETIERTAKEELIELERREKLYRNGRPAPRIGGRPVIIVDDGVATGATMKVAIRALQRREPSKIVVAVPVGSSSTCLEIKAMADEVVCPMTPEPFMAVGNWYSDFEQTTDAEVAGILEREANRKR